LIRVSFLLAMALGWGPYLSAAQLLPLGEELALPPSCQSHQLLKMVLLASPHSLPFWWGKCQACFYLWINYHIE
jgi:hypothetical protein